MSSGKRNTSFVLNVLEGIYLKYLNLVDVSIDMTMSTMRLLTISLGSEMLLILSRPSGLFAFAIPEQISIAIQQIQSNSKRSTQGLIVEI
jgi:hypothetical protein